MSYHNQETLTKEYIITLTKTTATLIDEITELVDEIEEREEKEEEDEEENENEDTAAWLDQIVDILT